jgi:twitching motility two-component system response regulator PilH
VKKILVVEDHKDSCLWIAAVLRQCGFTALEAADGAIAVRMAHQEKPDLILLDLHLPAGGGEFVMESLSRQPDTAGIPIVIMTGDPDVDRTQMKLKGAVEVFCKPMDVHAFLNTIRRALEPTTEPVPRATGSRETTGSSTDLLPA